MKTEHAMAYERLIRKLLQLPKRPAVVLMQVTAVHWDCPHVVLCTARQTRLCDCCSHRSFSKTNAQRFGLVEFSIHAMNFMRLRVPCDWLKGMLQAWQELHIQFHDNVAACILLVWLLAGVAASHWSLRQPPVLVVSAGPLWCASQLLPAALAVHAGCHVA